MKPHVTTMVGQMFKFPHGSIQHFGCTQSSGIPSKSWPNNRAPHHNLVHMGAGPWHLGKTNQLKIQ